MLVSTSHPSGNRVTLVDVSKYGIGLTLGLTNELLF